MSLSTLGRRYERLLFFAAPLSLASVLTLFVVFATGTQKERNTGRCYENGAGVLEQKAKATEAIWSEFVQNKKSRLAEIEYYYKLRSLLINSSLEAECYVPLLKEVEPRAKEGPKELISSLRQDAKKLFSTPIKYPGVEIPEKASIPFMGTSVSIDLVLFAGLLQVVLAPLMLLWLGSLYNTRYRESLLIENAKLLTDVFPHLINIYPAVRYPEPKKRSHIEPYLKHIFSLVYTCIRVGLLSMLVGPAVAAYVASIVLLDSSNYFALHFFFATLVVVFTLAVVICEFMPWHYGKTFPGPPLVKKRE